MKKKHLISIVFLVFIVFISGCIQQISEPKIMQSGLHYDTKINKMNYNISKVVEQANLESYAIRILKTPSGCRNPLPSGGCKGGDYIPAEYEYINTENETMWGISPKWIAINEENSMAIYFYIDDYWVHILAPYPNNEDQWSIKFVPLKEIQTKNAKEIINQEFVKIGILSKGSKINMVFGEGSVPMHTL